MPRALRSVRLHGGQGDVIMAIHGLQALHELGVPVLADSAVIYTRSGVQNMAQRLLPNVTVKSLEGSKHAAHPRYVIVPHTSWSTVLRNWLYIDWYINFPERKLLASYGYPRPDPLRRAQLWLTDLKLGPGTRWRRETPAYYGLKIWAPLAERFGLTDTDLMRGLYMAYRTLSERLRAAATPRADVPAVAFFLRARHSSTCRPTLLKSCSRTPVSPAATTPAGSRPTTAGWKNTGVPD